VELCGNYIGITVNEIIYDLHPYFTHLLSGS